MANDAGIPTAVLDATPEPGVRKRTFSSYSYSAFISYAHDDDKAWNWWISSFSDELDMALGPRLRIRVPPVHLSSKNGPIQGPLNDGLRKNIALSYAMVVFVHDKYLLSEWCLQELKHFRDLHGDKGFRERFYIIAMSEDAIERLTQRPTWKELFPNVEMVWMPFFRDDNRNWPIKIYVDNTRQKQAVVLNDFFERFLRLREDLAAKINQEVDAETFVPTYPISTGSSEGMAIAEERNLVRIYIESIAEQQKYWEPLGKQIATSWDQVVALEQVEPPILLRPTGLPMTDLEARPMLDDADGVVLLWGKKTPESLAAQISKVEPKLSGPHFAPGLVAYLMEKATDQPVSSTINNWPVVRFSTRSDGSATVLADDAPMLAKFLKGVLVRKRGG